jgi:hypothetical protein
LCRCCSESELARLEAELAQLAGVFQRLQARSLETQARVEAAAAAAAAAEMGAGPAAGLRPVGRPAAVLVPVVGAAVGGLLLGPVGLALGAKGGAAAVGVLAAGGAMVGGLVGRVAHTAWLRRPAKAS